MASNSIMELQDESYISKRGAKDSRSNPLQEGEDDVIQDHDKFEGPDLWVKFE